MKTLLYRLIYHAGIHRIFYSLNYNKLTILLYHGVAEEKDFGIYNYRKKFISPENFKRQIEYLRKNYNVLELDKAIEMLKNKEELPPNSLAITFDDGYKNFYDFAYPVLKKYGLPATVFLATDFIEKRMPLWTDRLEYAIGAAQNSSQQTREEKIIEDVRLRQEMKTMTEDAKNAKLQEIENARGKALIDFNEERNVYAPLYWNEADEVRHHGICFGAHTETHPILTKIPPEQAKKEMENSKKIIEERIRKASAVFSYPNGQPDDFNDNIKGLARETGFKACLTTIPGCNGKAED